MSTAITDRLIVSSPEALVFTNENIATREKGGCVVGPTGVKSFRFEAPQNTAKRFTPVAVASMQSNAAITVPRS